MGGLSVGVLVSGNGSNLQALIDGCAAGTIPARIACVISHRPGVLALDRATAAGIPAIVVDHRGFVDRAAFEDRLDRVLREHDARFLCLAGFMRVLTPGFVARWEDRALNIHPSLLPLFPGLDTHARALAAGMRVHGCTVHIVRPALDDGPILVQGVVPVLDDDDAERLAARVLTVEHRAYPLALKLVAEGRVTIAGGRARIAGPMPAETGWLVSP